jgi:hypothetical protein
MTERTDQFDERDQLEGIEPPVHDDTDAGGGAGGDAAPDQGPDAFGAPEGGKPT